MRYAAYCFLMWADEALWPTSKANSDIPRWRTKAADWCYKKASRLEA